MRIAMYVCVYYSHPYIHCNSHFCELHILVREIGDQGNNIHVQTLQFSFLWATPSMFGEVRDQGNNIHVQTVQFSFLWKSPSMLGEKPREWYTHTDNAILISVSNPSMFGEIGDQGNNIHIQTLQFSFLYVYIIPLITYFTKHGGGCSQKWELQYLYVYIIPLVFPQAWRGFSEKWELHCLYVYIIPLITYFTKHGGGCSQKWELQCLYVYIIPLITYFPNKDV